MPTNYWDGSSSDEWTTAANWSLGTVPADGEDVVLDGRDVSNITVASSQGGIDLASLTIMSSFTGNIGTAGLPLIIEVSGDLIIEGTGSYYILSGSAGGTTNGAIDRTIINTSGSVFLGSQLNGATYTTKFTDVYVKSGTVTIYGDEDTATVTTAETGTAITNLFLSPTFGRGGGVTVTVGDACYNLSGPTGTDITMEGGTLNLCSQAKTIDQFGGALTHGTTGYSMDANDDSITTLNLFSGTFKWQPSVVAASVRTTAAPEPTITTANIYGGTFDGTGMLAKVTTDPTVTTAYLYEGATLNLDNGYANFIFTALKDYGGTILKSTNQALTLS